MRRLLLWTAALCSNTQGFVPMAPARTSTRRVAPPSSPGERQQRRPFGRHPFFPAPLTIPLLSAKNEPTKTPSSRRPSQSLEFHPLPALAWVALLFFAIVVAPGEPGAAADAALFAQFLDNPSDPSSLGAIFYVIFNLFAVAPIVLLQLLWPQDDAEQKWLPLPVFAIVSSAIGFFALGPYLALRRTVTEPNDAWFVQRAAENKSLSGIAIVLTLFFYSNLIGLTGSDVAQYQDMVGSSQLVSVSSVDLLLLSITAASLIPKDYELRAGQDGTKIAILAGLFPWLGPALYCVWRPPLVDRE